MPLESILTTSHAEIKSRVVSKIFEKNYIIPEQVDRTIDILLQGREIASNIGFIGYERESSAYRAFKDSTGMSVREFKKKYSREIEERIYARIRRTFFDEISSESAYIVGALFGGYERLSKDTFYFKTGSMKLARLFKEKLRIPTPIERKGNTYRVKVRSDYISKVLESYGLYRNKVFPDMDPKFLRAFVRGYSDNRSRISKKDGKNTLTFKGDKSFLKTLSKQLNRHANTDKEYNGTRDLVYGHSDSIKIFRFMYHRKNDLYLREKYALFNPSHDNNEESRKLYMEMGRRIEQSMPLVNEGKRATQIFRQFGFENVNQYYSWFKRIKGFTLNEYTRENVDPELLAESHPNNNQSSKYLKKVVKKLLEGKKIKEIRPKDPQNLVSMFKRKFGFTPGEFKRRAGVICH